MYTFSGSKYLNVDNENMFPLSSIVQYVAHILQKKMKNMKPKLPINRNW